MGDTKPDLRTEVVAVGDPRAEMLAILRHYYRAVKDGRITGLMVIAELPEGAYAAAEAKVSSTENLSERLGRLWQLGLDMREAAREDDEG